MGNSQPKGFIAKTPIPDKKHRNFKFDYKEGFSKKPTLPPKLAKIEDKEAKTETTIDPKTTTPDDNNNHSTDQKTTEETTKEPTKEPSDIKTTKNATKTKVPKTKAEIAEAAAAKLVRVRQISGFHMQLAQNLIAPKNKIKKISSIFQYVRTLGKGATGRVLQVIYKKNQKTYALKELLRAHPRNSKLFVREVVILRQLSKINGIMQIYDTFMDKYCYFICVEFSAGGDLLEWILDQEFFSERKAADYIQSILLSVQQMHKKNIVHRDIKPNNIIFDKPHTPPKLNLNAMLKQNSLNIKKKIKEKIQKNKMKKCLSYNSEETKSKNTEPKLVIIDFGDSQIVEPSKTYKEVVGTMQFVPPELYKARTDLELKAGDMWSIGVLTFVLCCGMLPFDGDNSEERFAAITAGKYMYPARIQLTRECQHFIDSLLQQKPTSRLTVADALTHEWIVCKANTAPLNADFFTTLRTMHDKHKLQEILANVIMAEMSGKEKSIMMKGLQKNGKDGDDVLLGMNINNNIVNEKEIFKYLIEHQKNKLGQRHQKSDKFYKLRATEVMRSMRDWRADNCPFEVNMGEKQFSNIDEDAENDVAPVHVGNSETNVEMDVEAIEVDDEAVEEVDDSKEEMDGFTEVLEISSEDRDIVGDMEPIPMDSPKSGTGMSISVENFRCVMDKSEKKYNVDEIVEYLDPEQTGFIDFECLNSYHKRVNSFDTNSKSLNTN